MELFYLLGIIVVVLICLTPLVAFMAYVRTRRQEDEIRRLQLDVSMMRRRLRELTEESSGEPARTSARAPDARPAASRAVEEAVEEAEPAPSEAPVSGAAGPATKAGKGGAAGERLDELFTWARPGSEGDAARGPQSTVEEEAEGGDAEDGSTRHASAGAGAAADDPKADASDSAVDLETLIGSTWLLRIGLGVLAIAFALFARSILPQLSPGAKVALAYAGAVALFGTGKYFEASLEKFARPVMAAGLSFGFFVAFASHFVPAMSAVALPVSIAWMFLSMGTVLVAAERWSSQWTAGLAILLGHISAFVTVGDAQMYALVLIAFLAVTGAVLTLRHRWLPLGLFAIAASYGSHLLWLLADRDPLSGDIAFWLNLCFLTSYYVAFLVVDVLWWKRERAAHQDTPEELERVARQLGPANLVLYASLTSFAYLATGAGLDTIEWFYLTLGTVQGVLAWYYWTIDHRDYVFYPAFGTVLWTLGWFAALDALALNLVLAAQALLLLLAAHHTRLLVFHALAQLALVVAFVHWLLYPVPATSRLGLLIGGLGIASVYLLKAALEEVWYGTDAAGAWAAEDDPDRPRPWLEKAMDAVLRPVAPHLAKVHATMGGVVLVRELRHHFSPERGFGAALAIAAVLVAGLTLFRRRGALLFTVTTLAVGTVVLAGDSTSPAATLATLATFAALAVVVAHLADSGRPHRFPELAAGHTQVVVGAVLFSLLTALETLPLTLVSFVAALGVPALALLYQERIMAGGFVSEGERRADRRSVEALISVAVCALVGLVLFALVASGVGQARTAPLWVAGLSVLVAAVSLGRSSAQLFLTAYVLLLAGDIAIATSPVVWDVALATPWIGLPITAVPLLFALGMDRAVGGRIDADEPVPGPAGPMTYLMFALGLFMAVSLADANLGRGWSLLAPAVLGLVMVLSSRRLRSQRSEPSAIVLFVGLHMLVLGLFMDGARVDNLLLPLLLLSLSTLLCEQSLGEPHDERLRPYWPRLRLGLIVIATLTAMAAIYESVEIGVQWATAGWSVLGVSLMAAGFALRSASHRRVALALLAICLLRVFIVDTQGLSDTARTAAFGVLGLCLLGVAWLYSRFSEELKSWL